MRRTRTAALVGGVVAAVVTTAVPVSAGEGRHGTSLAAAFAGTTRSTPWEQVQRIPLEFETHHPQGFALVGDTIFMSSVEILEATVRYPEPVDGYDRTPGRGVGHVFVMDRQGRLLQDIVVGEGDVYHPGGVDFDGESVWVPVAEYRPDSASIVYRIDPDSYATEEAFRVDDHVGGLVRNRVDGVVHGVSWGSRRLLSWTPGGRPLGVQANQDHMLDYQDCAYAGDQQQLCSGVTGLAAPGGGSYELGGLALRDLRTSEIVHEVPFPRFSTAGHAMTRNPVSLEVDGDVLRLFAAPDDGEEVAGTELFVFEAPIG